MRNLRRSVSAAEQPGPQPHVRRRSVPCRAAPEAQPRECSTQPRGVLCSVQALVPSEPREGAGACRWAITDHAVKRFIKRIRRGYDWEQARDELEAICNGAHFVKALAHGVEQWRGPKPLRVRLRVHKGALLTVIPDCDGRTS